MSILPDVSQRGFNKNIENDLAGSLPKKVGNTSQSVAWPQEELYRAIAPPHFFAKMVHRVSLKSMRK